MEAAAIGAAKWVLGKVVSKLSDNALEAWAATENLGSNVRDLKKELLRVNATLHGTQGKEMSSNPALVELLQQLGQLTDEAEDMLDELEYFRIQDELDGTQEAADQPGDGLLLDAAFHARHAAVNVVTKWLPCLPAFDASLHGGCMDGLASAANTVGKSLLCCCSSCLPAVPDIAAREPLLPAVPQNRVFDRVLESLLPVVDNLESDEATKLVFDRVGMSENMERILGELRPICVQVTTLLHLELSKSNNRTAPPQRPETSSTPLDDKVFGRDGIRDNIIAHMIGGVKHVAAKDDLSVFVIWGHGGVGKTTLAQYVYNDPKVNKHFDVKVWICVSHGFDVTRLTHEILTGILVYLGEQGNSSPQGNLDQLQKEIKKNLGSKKFLLVLDDIWECHDEDWKRLIAPFRKGQIMVGSTILVTSRFEALAQKITVSTDDCKLELTGLEGDDFQSYFYRCIKNWKSPEDELKSIGDEIIKKLKGSPLAAKTVGRLLGTELSARHWRQVLESKKWESQKNDHDIMPALKLSFDYLPFHLQECFSFCALFPEDYEFGCEELIRFWMGAGIIYSNYFDQSKRVEDIGVESLKELVYHGFFKRIEGKKGPVFVMHDLMHDLAVQVSSHKYLSINSSNIKSIDFSSSVCHLSIFIDGDVKYYEDFRRVFWKSMKTLKIENLRTLIFGGDDFVFTDIFRDMFREVKGLRVLHLSDKSNPPESILHNFSKLAHLRYLRLASRQPSMSLPKALSRFYQLKVLDLLQWRGSRNLPRDMSNLRMLRHFVADKKMHSSIWDVGKLKFLQELKAFDVKTRNGTSTFELSQLGELMELRGSLSINDLEKVKNGEEADNAKLSSKTKLDKLKLFWNLKQYNNTAVDEVLESLRPHSNLERLHIGGHRGTTCPTWLGTSVKSLESLCLCNVSWETLPPFGQLLKLKNLQLKHLVAIGEFGIEGNGYTMEKSFKNLKRLELAAMPKLEKWVGGKTCHLLSNLEVLIVTDCPELVELPYSQYSSSSMQDENSNWFPKLQELTIARCPNLSLLPLIPYTSTLCSITIDEVGSCLNILDYEAKDGPFGRTKEKEWSLKIELKEHPTSDFKSLDENVLAFHNLTKLEKLVMTKCPPLALKHLQMLKSLKRLKIRECKRIILDVDEETNPNCQLPIEYLKINQCSVSGKELSQLLFCLPALSGLTIRECQGLKRMGVVEEQQHQVIEEDEGLLLFPSHFSTSLRELCMFGCSDLRLVMLSAAEMAGEGRSRGLQGLHSLLSLTIKGSPNIFSAFDSSSPSCDEDMTSHCCPFPSSLQHLSLEGVEGIPSLALSNLTFLTYLDIEGTRMGWHEVAQHVLILVNLNYWEVGRGCLKAWESEETEKEKEKGEEKEPPHLLPSSSSQPHPQVLHFQTSDLPGFLMAPSLCTRLSSSLQTLVVVADRKMKGFTTEQEQALQLLTSLQVLEFYDCKKLRSIPAGLHHLRNLKRLEIWRCRELRNGVAELLTRGNLMELRVMESPNFFSADWEPWRGAAASTAVPNSSRLQKFVTSDIAGFLMAPSLCSLLSSSLQTLVFDQDDEEGFTAEQEQALQLLTSLQHLEFQWCRKLRSLPTRLHRLRNLKRLKIEDCPEIRSLPKEGLPSSLQQLVLSRWCSNELKRECTKLRNIPEIIV